MVGSLELMNEVTWFTKPFTDLIKVLLKYPSTVFLLICTSKKIKVTLIQTILQTIFLDELCEIHGKHWRTWNYTFLRSRLYII